MSSPLYPGVQVLFFHSRLPVSNRLEKQLNEVLFSAFGCSRRNWVSFKFRGANFAIGTKATAEATTGNRFLVSKKHLMLASRRASKVLGGSFKEATPEKDGLFHWNFEPIFGLKAFEIVMHIIHGQTRHVPEKVNIDLLAQIAAIVDDLECQNSIWFFAKRWLSQIESPNFQGMSKDLMRWILISFVFEESDIFKQTTNGAIRYSTSKLPTFDLPIRSKIIGRFRDPY